MDDMMVRYPIQKIELPPLLSEIPDAPSALFIRGKFPTKAQSFLTVVGSRKYSPYGKQVCEKLISGLRGYPVAIVSGLALGIDGIAHKTALKAGLTTIAVPGSGLDDSVLYPKIHRTLAHGILEAGGALLSEFQHTHKPRPENFPQRNRIMAGMSHAVLVIEAEIRSGTLITSRLAIEYNRDVGTVPGPIHSKTTEGPHMLLRNGATLIRNSEDILEMLGIKTEKNIRNSNEQLSPEEKRIRDLLVDEPLPRDEIVSLLHMPTHEANILLTSLELKGYITEQLGVIIWQ
jgi:DNA processing protein